MKLPLDLNSTPSEALASLGRFVFTGMLVLLTWFGIQTAINAPHIRDMIEEQNAAEMREEDRAFCGRFAMAAGTQLFDACAHELRHIRRLHGAPLQRQREMSIF